jgi:hypothetical protein
MSKKIWRGRQFDITPAREVIECTIHRPANNVTVVPDHLCFPVREAMALCEAAVRCGFDDLTVVKYLRAKERMQKKASKK